MEKKYTKLYGISLMIIGIIAIILLITEIAGIEVPIVLKGIMCAADIAALSVMIYAVIKKRKLK